MDAFEQVVATLFFRQGYWVAQGFKVELSKEEKKAIGRKTSPRWEIDLVAYKGGTRELLAIECKSFLDSGGVDANEIINPAGNKSRYKLFVEEDLRCIVLERLAIQMYDAGLVPANVTPQLALVIGKKISEANTKLLREHFSTMGWQLFDNEWLLSKLKAMADDSYFDSVEHVVSKLIFRAGPKTYPR